MTLVILMLLGLCFLVCLATVPAAAGRLALLGDLRLRGTPFLVAALAIQIVIVYLANGAPKPLLAAAFVSTYALALVFVMANRTLPGVPLIAAGGGANLFAIVVNGGVMPASPRALEQAGLEGTPAHFSTSVAATDARFGFLGDVFATPSWLPIQNVFSIGDVILVVGVAVTLHALARSRVALEAERLARAIATSMPVPALGFAGLGRPVSIPLPVARTRERSSLEPPSCEPRRRGSINECASSLAGLIVEFGANVQPGQVVGVLAEVGQEHVVRHVAAAAYWRGAQFVDVTYFDPFVKRARLLYADEKSLGFVPPWHGDRISGIIESGGALIGLQGPSAVNLFGDVHPGRAGKDRMPYVDELATAVDEALVNWTIAPAPSAGWARALYPYLDGELALERLWDDIATVCRLDEPDPRAAWRSRTAQLGGIAAELTAARFDQIRFVGPGTDLTLGLLPTSSWSTIGGLTSLSGIRHVANIPSEEVFTTPDPTRATGHATMTRPVQIGGVLGENLQLRFNDGQLADARGSGAEALLSRSRTDDGAARVGEIGLVDASGRVSELGTVFYEALLDENAATHVAIGSGWASAVEPVDRARVNRSTEHVDLMIGSRDLVVLGRVGGSERVILERGRWQL